MHFKVAEFTHIGSRADNQDYFCHVSHSDWGCFMVADGLGGHEMGDIASKYFLEALSTLCPIYAQDIQEQPVAGVRAMTIEASRLFRERIADEFGLVDAQTTLTLAWVNPQFVITAHVGDSRIYRINNDHISWRSPDHTIVQQYYDQGKITEEDMLDHPMQNRLLRTINTYQTPDPEINIHPALGEHESLLLCTDGFWTQVDDASKISLVHSQDMLKTLKDKVIDVTQNTEHCDNVTAQVVQLQSRV